MISMAVILSACSKDSNPAVPAAPEEDVITIVDRNPSVRVGLLSFTPQKNLYVSITGGTFKCYVGESMREFSSGISGDIHKFTGTEDLIEYLTEGAEDPRELENEVVRIEPAEGSEGSILLIGTSRSNLRPYRGILTLILEGKNLLAVNTLPMEDYLLGVVPAEMDPDWPDDALMAQAVVSRTCAIFNLNRYDGRGFDLSDDERSQEYGGMIVESDSTTDSVVETVNEIVTYEERLAIVVFHEESGGMTASSLDVWPYSGDIPYLAGISDVVGIIDFSDGGNYLRWSNWASFEDLHEAFNLDGETFAGEFMSAITVMSESENGRVQTIEILGEKIPVLPAMTVIHVLNRRIEEDFVPSNRFDIGLENDGYRFTGSGKGHGVGMSQWGAYQRALDDQDYEFIISQYYPGCEVTAIPTSGIEVVHNTRVDMIR